MTNSIAYIVYPGMGKTSLSKKDSRFVDLEVRPYKELGFSDYESANLRGQPIRDINPEFPGNYYKAGQDAINNSKTLLLVPKQSTYDLIDALKIQEYAWILPNTERLAQLQSQMQARGDDQSYIENNIGKRYNEVLDLAAQTGKEIIFAQAGQFLADILKEIK
ncbi:MAG: hypothetical protein LBB23_01435 [Rickettsiales bacterium]|jgi:hypothetical protein|nr:hypothetical protein [Rickettsiales bacterium]